MVTCTGQPPKSHLATPVRTSDPSSLPGSQVHSHMHKMTKYEAIQQETPRSPPVLVCMFVCINVYLFISELWHILRLEYDAAVTKNKAATEMKGRPRYFVSVKIQVLNSVRVCSHLCRHMIHGHIYVYI